MSGTGNNIAFIPATGDAFIDGVLTNYRWSDSIIYYSFPSNNSVYSYTQLTGIPANFSALSSAQEDAANFALNTAYGGAGFTATASAGFAVEGFTNASIVLDTVADTTDKEHIRLANTSPAQVGTARVADFPGNSETTQIEDNGDVWFGGSGDNPTAGNYDWHTVLHEIGHALGLSHGHSTFQKGVALPTAYDSMEYSIMTYRSYVNDPLVGGYSNETWGYAQTYMMADIAALQHMYGANYSVNSGNTVYKWNPTSGDTLVNGEVAINAGGNRIFATIWDGGGTDTYDLSSYSSNLTLDLRPGLHSVFSTTQLANLGDGNTSRGNIFNARLYNNNNASLIENAIGGSGNDVIRGNDANNVLTGNAGNDSLYGYDGGDTLIGGAGNDAMYGGNGNDTFSYTAATAPLGLSEYLDGGVNYDRVLLNGAGIFNFGVDFNVTGVEELEFAADGANVDKTIIMGNKELDSSFEWLNLVVDGNNNTGSDDTIIVNLGYSANVNLSGWTFIDWVTSGSNIDRIYINGDANNNTITGTSQNDIIVGGAGVDTINGGGGNDHITSDGDGGTYNGDAGNDIMLSGLGGEIMDGGSGIDTIDHRAFNGAYIFNMVTGLTNFGGESYLNFENVYMGDGNDTVTGTSSANSIYGYGGNDTINGGSGDDYIVGGDGDDVLNGDSGIDTIFGGNGNDTINGGSFKDTVYGQAGNDTFLVTGGDYGDNIYGGTDIDHLDLSGWTNSGIAFMVDLSTSSYEFMPNAFGVDGEYILQDVENVTGSNYNDVITGDGGANVLDGGGGNDTVNGGGGDDIVRGGAGNDNLNGGGGTDMIYGGDGDDLLSQNYGGPGELLDGGNGTDTATWSYSASNWVIDLVAGTAKLGATVFANLVSIENVAGGSGNDTITGDTGDNILWGRGGNDVIRGGGGNNTIYGDDGDDRIFRDGGGVLQDAYYGGTGIDTIDTNGMGFASTVVFDMANNIMTVSGSNYEVWNGFENYDGATGTGGESVIGTAGDNIILTGSGNNTIDGGAGNDTIDGGGGDDTIIGGAGVDTINGGGGNDHITSDGDGGTYNGNGGNDMMLSGLGGEIMDGGLGIDTIDHRAWNGTYVFDMVTGLTNFGGESYTNFEHVFMGDGTNTVTGNSANNEIRGGNGVDTVSGGGGGDKIWGYKGNDVLSGNGGKDKIYAGDGDDMLFGDISKDRLYGGRHKDILEGGVGNDFLKGGQGKDKFDFLVNGDNDKIADFTDDADTLRLDEDLWGGGLSKAAVIAAYASVVGADVVFDFGGGDTIKLLGFGATGTAALQNDLAFI